MENMRIPDNLASKIRAIHGTKGQLWLTMLPTLLKKYQELWGINILNSADCLSYNLVLHVEDRLAKKKLILKATVPNPDFAAEIYALKYFAGNGCVQLINYDTNDGIMLLEEANPGTTLAALSRDGHDQDAIVVCCDVINSLHAKQFNHETSTKSLNDDYSEFKRFKDAYQEGSLPIDLDLISQAEQEYAYLLHSTKKQVLLHADLHHNNILRAEREDWLAIDPKGIVGDPAFELAAFIRNPYPGILKIGQTKQFISDRIDLFAECLAFDKRRIWGWSFSHTLLAAAWLFEEQDPNWTEWHYLTKILLELKPD